MRITVAGVLLFTLGLICSANNSGVQPHNKIQTEAVKTDARKAWPKFFAGFRMAVAKQDRDALRKMMTKEFNGPPNTIEDAFTQWDNPKVKGWAKLQLVLAKGAVLSDESENDSPPESIRPTMISPPAAERGKRYRGWFAAFEFQEDGNWYCIQFTSIRDFSR